MNEFNSSVLCSDLRNEIFSFVSLRHKKVAQRYLIRFANGSLTWHKFYKPHNADYVMAAKENFECMICDHKCKVKAKGFHLGICKDCVRRIKVDWPVGKDVPVVTDDKPL